MRLYLIGYRTDDRGVKISSRCVKAGSQARSFPRHGYRAAVSSSLFGRISGVVLMKPDLRDPWSSAEGFLARLGALTPSVESPSAFHIWATARYRRIYAPVPPDADLSVGTWLMKTGWPAHVCEGLLQLSREPESTLRDMIKYKAFNKDEWYSVYKFFRAIMGRTDAVKILLGPAIRAIEESIFSHGAFVKKIPIPQRPDYIRERFYAPSSDDELTGCVEGDDGIFAHNGKIFENDVESLEAHFAGERRQREIELCSHMLQNHPFELLVLLALCYNGQYAQSNGLYSGYVEATRGSGDFQTSVGNGAENESACKYLTITCAGRDITNQDWADIGFKAKCHSAETMGELSFCGMTFSDHSNIVVRDPLPVLARLGWTPARYSQARPAVLWQLLRLRGLALAHEMGRCPILWVLAQRICEITLKTARRIRKSLIDSACEWDRSRLLSYTTDQHRVFEIISPPDAPTREFFADRYQIPVLLQHYVEDILSEWDLVEPLELPLDFPVEWRDHFDSYAMTSRETCETYGSDPTAVIEQMLPPRLSFVNPDGSPGRRMSAAPPIPTGFIKT